MKMVNINGVEFRIGIDKTTIGIKYPNLPKKELELLDENSKQLIIDAQEKFFGQEMHLRKMIETTGNFKKISKKDQATRYIITAEDNTPAFEFHLGRVVNTCVINLQFNPSKMTYDAKAELDGLLSVSFMYGYHEFYERTVISTLELYVDALDIDASKYVLVDLGRRKKTDYENTTYYGKHNSRLTMANYDKAKQLKTDDSIERFECRIHNRNLYFKDYVEQEQKNPFKNFVLIARQDLQSIALNKGGPKFAAALENFGLYRAVANKPARERIKQLILSSRVSWWDVDTFWGALREELLLLRPNSFLQ